MACPQIYLGTGRAAGPLPALYGNDSIVVSGSPLIEGAAITIPMTAYNHGDTSPITSLELYWSDPTTGFMAVPSHLVGSVNFTSGITGASTLPPTDGMAMTTFGWTPDATVLGTNGGHVCLLARLNNLTAPADGTCSQQTYNSASPATDPLSAIHNVQIIAPPAPKPPSPGPRRHWPMWFAFAATNTLRDHEDTKLLVRALDPGRDREKLEGLVANAAVDRALACRRLKFAVPNGVQVAEGRERLLTPLPPPHLPPHHGGTHTCTPRISRLGAVTAELAPHLILPGSKLREAARGPLDLKLLPGEQRQTLVQVEPGDHENAVYAIEVAHEGANGHAIGGLVLLFVPPHNYF